MTGTRGSSQSVVAIVGPTASGKSDLAIELALRTAGEIVNCDSVQVYKGIEIATAKVPHAERRGVPHHLIDFVPPEIDYTAGEYARDAARVIEEIEQRGRPAILVGGTGFYLRALRRPFFESPPTDIGLRRRINLMREEKGALHVYRMLLRVDPHAASGIHKHDWPRVQRALEVCLQTGQPFSSQKSKRRPAPGFVNRLKIVALLPPRQKLYERINLRTEGHFKAGLIEEVRHLLEIGVPAESSALGAHGYRRVVELLRGKRDLPGAIEQTKLDVRHYAKRQLTWFRHEPGVTWYEGFGEENDLRERVFRSLAL